MWTYLRRDYAIHQCGAGYEYCDGECSHCKFAQTVPTTTTTTSTPTNNVAHKSKIRERKVALTDDGQTRNDEVAFGTTGKTY